MAQQSKNVGNPSINRYNRNESMMIIRQIALSQYGFIDLDHFDDDSTIDAVNRSAEALSCRRRRVRGDRSFPQR